MKEKTTDQQTVGLCGNIEYNPRKQAAARRKDLAAKNLGVYDAENILRAIELELVIKNYGYSQDCSSARGGMSEKVIKGRMDEINLQFEEACKRFARR